MVTSLVIGLVAASMAQRHATRRFDGKQHRDPIWADPRILLAGARDGDHIAVQNAIDHDSNLDTTDPITSRTALLDAAANGHREIVELLVAHDADMDVADRTTGRPALLEAAANGHHEIVALLLARDVNEEILDSNLEGLAHLAARAGFPQVLSTVRDAQLDRLFDRVSGGGLTPLMIAAEGTHAGHTGCVAMLVDREANGLSKPHIDDPQSNGVTPIMSAATYGNIGTLQYLIAKKAALNRQDQRGFTAMHWAIERQNTLAAELLWRAGASTNLMDNQRLSVKKMARIYAGPDSQMRKLSVLLPEPRAEL